MKKIVMEQLLLDPEDIMSDHTSSILKPDPVIELLGNKDTLNQTPQIQVEEECGSIEPFSMVHMDEYDTGDIILFSDRTYIPSLIIEYLCGSKYSHVGMILKDPTFIKSDLTGLYILESTGSTAIPDIEDNKVKTGVQIRRLEDVCKEYQGAIFWRKLHIERDVNFNKIIEEVHNDIYNKPYDFDPRDWLEGLLNIKFSDTHRTSKFFCSALVTYIYYRLGLVGEDTPWTIIRPKDLGTEFSLVPSRFFGTDASRVNISKCTLDKEVMVRSYDTYLHYLYRTY